MKKNPLKTTFNALSELSLKRLNRLALLGACIATLGGYVDKADATVAIDADFTTYSIGNLTGQNSWAQVAGNNTATPIQVIAAASPTPQSIKLKGIANAAVSYRDLPTASQFNPVGATAEKSFHYVIENFRVTQAYVSSGGAGSGVCVITSNVGGTGTYLSRLYVRRIGGNLTNTTQFDLGLNPGGAGVVYGTTALSIGTPYKIVVSYTANASPTSDVVKVYVNPVGLNPASWTPEISQTLADPTVSMKSFIWTPGSPSTATNELTASRLMVGDTLSELLLPPSVPTVSAATFIAENGFTANWSAVEGATKYYLDVATDSAFASLVSGFNGLDVGSATSKAVTGTFSTGATLYYRVRSANANATSVSSGTQSVTLAAPTEKNYVSSNSTGSANWNDTSTWTGAVVPVASEIASLTLDGAVSGTLNSTNNLVGNLTLNGLSINNTGSGSLNVTGNPLQFVTNTALTPNVAPKITFANAVAVSATLSNGLVLAADLSIFKSSSAGASTMSSAISGTGALIKKSSGSVTLTGNSSFSGGLRVNDGEIVLNAIGNTGANSPIGTSGTISLGSTTTTGSLKWGEALSGATEVSDKGITLLGTTGGGNLNVRGNNSLTLTGAIDTGSDTSSRSMQFFGNGGNLTISGLISGNGRLRIGGSDNRNNYLTNENNSFTGGVSLDGNTASKFYRTYVSKIGVAGSNSPLGTNATINFGYSGSAAFNFLYWTPVSGNETTDKVINLAGATSGGLLVNKSVGGTLTFSSNVTATGVGAKTLYLDQDDATATTVINGSIPDSSSGATAINKNGNGTLTLGAANTFSGNVTIKGGTLQLGNKDSIASGVNVLFPLDSSFGPGTLKLAYSGDSSLGTIQLSDNATINLGSISGSSVTFASHNFTAGKKLTVANSSVGKLYITSLASTTDSTVLAAVVSAENPSYPASFDSNGLLSFVNPTPPSGFSSWIAGFSVADKTATGDSDNDGINNLLEYVLNGNPEVASTSILPSAVVTSNAFEFTFTRSADSKNDTTLTFQYGSTLAGWTDVAIPSSGTAGLVTVTGNTVKVSVPKTSAVGGKLFGRLKVAQ
ncbi:MAG: autotransporter-associated beta strand repeat-containing protein [Akkermansiaceae bacterium]|nr:autotransporter-associated beta strand repeat-containing protein [Akkermansiaceae bacterium]